MSIEFARLCLIAQRANWERMGDRFSGKHAELNVSDILTLLGLVACLALILLMLHRFSGGSGGRLGGNSRARLFGELCRAHGLGFAARRLLKRLAASRGLESPAMVFVAPGCFNTVDLATELKPSLNEVERLRARLFNPIAPSAQDGAETHGLPVNKA